ncbi:class II aldolase and Adducin N-terminal domain-containing protein [Nemania abortiva]|nr:class II aldolase and Adducin N-terminal domain-containing protein [Nemania abortiva]
MANLTQLLGSFITGLHILHYNGVLDAYGHMSMRNPNNSSTFFMSRNLPPALVSSLTDIVEYRVADASAVDPDAPAGFIERYIHSEVLKRFPAVNVVVHSHSPAVVPYGITDVPLKPSIHLAGFLGESVPVFDIAKHYLANDTQDLLVRNTRLGAALAAEFGDGTTPGAQGENTVVLMRNHGFTTCASDVPTAVFQAIYTQVNAQVQTSALDLQATGRASGAGTDDRHGVVYLTEQQAIDSWVSNSGTIQRPYSLWVRQVEVSPLYMNLVLF